MPGLREYARAIIPFPIRTRLYKFLQLGSCNAELELLLLPAGARNSEIDILLAEVGHVAARRAARTLGSDLVETALDPNSLAAFQNVLANAEPAPSEHKWVAGDVLWSSLSGRGRATGCQHSAWIGAFWLTRSSADAGRSSHGGSAAAI